MRIERKGPPPLSAAARAMLAELEAIQRAEQLRAVPVSRIVRANSVSSWGTLQALMSRGLVSTQPEQSVALTGAGRRLLSR